MWTLTDTLRLRRAGELSARGRENSPAEALRSVELHQVLTLSVFFFFGHTVQLAGS